MMEELQFFGKYRGQVFNNIDPLLSGRLLVAVPDVTGSELNWAMACMPYAGEKERSRAIPPLGTSVWVEFEGGDPDHPIWVGCSWGAGEVVFVGPAPDNS
jgi:hypothetical protein